MTTNEPACGNYTDLPKISDLQTQATFLAALAEAADILQYDAGSDPRARNALCGVIDAIETKANTLAEALGRIMDGAAA
ncbi:MAG: hypothetical protein KGN33_17285 [Paracoccaceae bacterium]|nr:hypothetical protein [Paracoccaceae bacterium]